MNRVRDLPREKWATTPELEDEVLREIQADHVGIRRAIKSRDLARRLGTTDRMVRACVNALRKRGHPLCSSVGEHAGFYIASTLQEYQEFRYRDYSSRIEDMCEVMRAMDAGAQRYFDGEPVEVELQPELITV